MTSSAPDSRTGPTLLLEEATDHPPALVHPGWSADFPWLVQGCTTRGSAPSPFDLGLFSGASSPEHVRACWTELLEATDMDCAIHAHQVHEADVRVHREPASGLVAEGDFDGHVTDVPGTLVAVATADCVPVFVVAPERRAVAALHAGWRGAAAGVLERGLSTMVDGLDASLGELRVHLGPSICGSCYEVGPEVFASLDQPVPDAPTPIDLRRVLFDRAVQAGVPPEQITISQHCTRCTDSGLYSHRGGDRERQVGYIGIRS